MKESDRAEFIAQQNTDSWRLTEWVQVGAKNWRKTSEKFWRVPHEVKLARMAICQDCDHYLKATTQCQQCYCFMGIKTWFGGFACPIEKWPAEETPNRLLGENATSE